MEKYRVPYTFYSSKANLDIIVNGLQRAKSANYNYYFDFLGHILESDTVTIEDAYLEVYGMSREEYRKKLKEKYELYKISLEEQSRLFKEEEQLKKQKIQDVARGIIPEDKMSIYEEAYKILEIRYFMNDAIQIEFIDYIKYLNSSEFSLQQALTMYKKFILRLTLPNYNLLRCLKELTIHGNELYNALIDEETIKKEKESIEAIHNLNFLPRIKLPEPTEEDLLTSYDIKITTYALLKYAMGKNKNEEGMTLK